MKSNKKLSSLISMPLASATLMGATLLLSACGGGSGGAAPGSTTATCASGTVCGTAATGAAMVGASISLKCKSGVAPAPTTTNNVGYYSVPVAAANLPCAVQVSQGSNNLYSFANSSGQITNVTPLTTLAMTQILGTVLDTTSFDTLSSTLLEQLNSANSTTIDTILDSLRSALASYALPPGFNPITTPLTAAAVGQAGNAYDGLLDQFAAANPSLATLLTTAATGTMPTLGTPSYTSAAADLSGFFSTFAGDYTLTVTSSGGEASSGTAAKALFPQDKALTVHIKSNGDVAIDAVGRTITWQASTYTGNGTQNTGPRTEFSANESGKNVLRYRESRGLYTDLYMTYDPSNGKLQIDPQGFVNNEGYASLRGAIMAPPAALPPPAPIPPTITSFSPVSGAVGATVTITGTGFSTTLANNIVRFSTSAPGPAPQATVVSGSATQLVVTVPTGAMSGQLTVHNGEAVVSSTESFTVNAGSGGDNPGTGGDYSPVGKARTFTFASGNNEANKAAVRTEMVGEYDVAIYAAPVNDYTGKGKLVIAYADETLTLTLKNAAGTELIKRSGKVGSDYSAGTITTEDQYAADPANVHSSDSTSGRRTGVYNYFQGGNSTGPSAYFSINVFSNGVIAGNTADYYFRNDITAYGPAIPSVFTALAGNFSGPAQQQLCSPRPNVALSISNAGRIVSQGKSPLSCTDIDADVTWDGQQDMLAPDVGGGQKLVLDASSIGGSGPGGMHLIKLDSSVPPQITSFQTFFAGSIGDLTSVALVKQ